MADALNKNKTYAVKKDGVLWAVIDCGETKTGGMAVGNFWATHFKHNGRTYRWYDKLFSPPPTVNEWDEISVITKQVTVVDSNGHFFEGWDDATDLCYKTFQKFAELIGHPMTIEEIRNIIPN